MPHASASGADQLAIHHRRVLHHREDKAVLLMGLVAMRVGMACMSIAQMMHEVGARRCDQRQETAQYPQRHQASGGAMKRRR